MFLLIFWTSLDRDCHASKKDPFCDARSMVSKWKIRANVAETNTAQTHCKVRGTWVLFCYRLCWGQHHFIASDFWLIAPFHISFPACFFFLFSPVGVGWRNVRLTWRGQTWSCWGKLRCAAFHTGSVIVHSCYQGLKHNCKEGSLALPSLSCFWDVCWDGEQTTSSCLDSLLSRTPPSS